MVLQCEKNLTCLLPRLAHLPLPYQTIRDRPSWQGGIDDRGSCSSTSATLLDIISVTMSEALLALDRGVIRVRRQLVDKL